jgi:predicted ATP-grasp superfamily ATP-dependent carboligase
MKRVLVLDALQRSALAVTRSLGRHGVPVITADETTSALAGCSRYSTGYFSYPSPRLYPGDFINRVAEQAASQDVNVILPMTELTAMLLIQNRAAFPDTSIPFPDIVTLNLLADKCSLIPLAESLGIPVPGTLQAENAFSLAAAYEDFDYPVVLKPGMSWLRHNGGWFRSSVRYANNSSEAESIVTTDPAFRAGPFLVQEYIEGKGQGVFALYDHGKALAFFSHRRLREKPPGGGVSVLSESVAATPALLSHARNLLDRLAWHGIAMVEFRVADDGTPYLMEVNTRFWGSLQLAVDSGVDFPWLLYQVACGTTPHPVGDFRTGVRLRWLLGDLDSLYLTLRDRQYSLSRKAGAVLHFLRPAPFKTRHEVNRMGDLAPFWWELREYARNLVR